ncbi:MAG: hypothetical protein ACR2HG_11745 [Pyrinomonadaceae bacterium]
MKTFNPLQILFLFLLCSVICLSQELRGAVKTKNGEPIEKAFVLGNDASTTDSKGNFKLKNNKNKILVVTKLGFRPQIKTLDKNQTDIEIVLEAEAEKDRLKIIECSEKSKGKKLGNDLQVIVPKKAESKKVFDVDYGSYVIWFGKKENKKWLEGWFGPNATSGHPNSEWIESSINIIGRSITNEKGVVGWDLFGMTKGGKSWRYISVLEDSVFYITDSSDAKIFFDRILDNSCTNLERYTKGK